MVKVTNDFGDRYSGKVGTAGVFATIWGIQYRRRWVKPSNPNTPAQQRVRNSFTNAVDKWHSFNPLQTEAYSPLASGLKMSGYNLFISRWQKMTVLQRSAYVAPIIGFKQLSSGAKVNVPSKSIVTNTPETVEASAPIVRDSVVFTKSTSNFDPILLVDILKGKATVIKAIASACTISYVAGGETVVDEAITASAEPGAIFELAHEDIDYKSVHVKVGGSEVDSLEVDYNAGKFYNTKTATFSTGASLAYDTFEPIENANIKMVKANTNFSTLNAYSDAMGVIKLAQTSEDGNRDISISEASHISQIKANVSPSNAGKDELIVMTAI